MTIDPNEGRECLNFSALLCSRLCHDLISPVGAISNGIEILREEDDPEMRDQVMTLLEDSARQTSNRLQFFRLAFGAAGGFGDRVDAREAQKVTSDLFAFGKARLNWQPDAQTLPKGLVKLLLNLILISNEALIRGGDVSVEMGNGENGSLLIKVVATGERYILAESTQRAFVDGLPPEDVEPRNAPAQLAYLIAKNVGATLYIDTSNPTSFTLGFSFNPS